MRSSRAGRARAGGRGAAPPGSRRASDPKRDRDWFLVVSPRQHQVHVSPQAQRSQLSERVPSFPLNLLEDTCWRRVCVCFGPGAVRPVRECSALLLLKSSTQHSGKLFPFSLFYLQGEIQPRP